MRKAFYLKQTKSGRAFDIFNGIALFVLLFITIYPFWNMLVLSFNDGTDALLGNLYFWPREWTLANYEYVFKNSKLLHGALVSVLRVLVGTATGVGCNALLGYICSNKNFYGRKFMRMLFLITMYFGGGLIPTYLLMVQLGFVNSFAVYIVPGLFSAYYMLLASSYMESIPSALFESARIDGASETRTFASIALPLAKPMLACIAVYIGVGHWNSWYSSLLYLQDRAKHPIQMFLREILIANSSSVTAGETNSIDGVQFLDELLKYCTIIISTVPILAVYPFVQKYFVTGMMIGSVKG